MKAGIGHFGLSASGGYESRDWVFGIVCIARSDLDAVRSNRDYRDYSAI